jgi:hypothetical protein
MCSTAVKQQALTRPRFDDFHQADDQRIATYQVRYMLNKPNHNCDSAFPVEATTRIQQSGGGWIAGMWKTDVESDLRGLGRPDSRMPCLDALYNPDTNSVNAQPYVNGNDVTFGHVVNRLTNPPCTLRATGWNRFDPLPNQPQIAFEQPFDVLIPARSIDKERCKVKSNT